MMRKLIFFTVGFALSFQLINAKSVKVSNLNQYKENVSTLAPGDSIILANGVWKDVRLVFTGKGKPNQPICLTAETKGKVTIEGESCLRLSGDWLNVSGLVFKNGHSPLGAVIDFRTSAKEYAYHSVVEECVIDRFSKQSKDSADHWVCLYGQKNALRYCYLGGKTNLGTTLVVWPDDENSINNEHHIYRNYFAHRPRLGSNGGETIRIGTSQVCLNSSRTIVESNYFEHCNGEVEIISNKSSDNKFLNNTFFECEGSLVLRHGNRATVFGNWFIGNGKEFTGGVRVINNGHLIYNNLFYQLRGDEFRSPLAVMNGIPDSPLNGYAQVNNVVIANNTYYDCSTPWALCVGYGERNRNARPTNTMLINNLVCCPKASDLIRTFDQTDGITIEHNVLINNKGTVNSFGGLTADVDYNRVNGLNIPYTKEKAKKLPFVKFDILGQLRSEAVIGAYQGVGTQGAVEMASAQNCGPQWFKPEVDTKRQEAIRKGRIVNVAAGSDLSSVLKKASDGDIFQLQSGEYLLSKRIPVSQHISIKAADGVAERPVLRLKADNANGAFFELCGDAHLTIDGIRLDGSKVSDFAAKYAFVTSKEDAVNYCLFIKNCVLTNFTVDAGSVMKGYKGSMADSIVVSNSQITNSFRGFVLSEEKEDAGKYSAEKVCFISSVFANINQFAIDYYRGGNDESTLGGSLQIDHCVFDKVAQTDKQFILKLTGIVTVDVKNSIFNESVAKTSLRLYGSKNKIEHCNFYDCELPKVEKNAISSAITTSKPDFEKNSYRLKNKSALKKSGTDGSDVGIK